MTANNSNSKARIASSEQMLRDITAEGITTENACLYDIATLKFKYNEIEAQTCKFMFEWPEDECFEIEESLLLVRKTVKHCLDQVGMNYSVGLAVGAPLAASTPEKNQTSTFHTANQSLTSNRNLSRLPRITVTLADNSSGLGSSREQLRHTQNELNATFDVSQAGTSGRGSTKSGKRAFLTAPEADRQLNATYNLGKSSSRGASSYDDEFSYIDALYNAVVAEGHST